MKLKIGNNIISRVQWERGYHDEAFDSLDRALHHARELEKMCAQTTHQFTAPLVRFVKKDLQAQGDPVVAKLLPEDWPFWCNPDCSEVEKEIKADPRWDMWVKKTQE